MTRNMTEVTGAAIGQVKTIHLEQGSKQILQIIRSSNLSPDDKELFEVLLRSADFYKAIGGRAGETELIDSTPLIIEYVDATLTWKPIDHVVGRGGIAEQITKAVKYDLLPAVLCIVVAKLGKLNLSVSPLATLETVGNRGYLQIIHSKPLFGFGKRTPRASFAPYALSRRGTTVLWGKIQSYQPERIEKVRHKNAHQFSHQLASV